MAKSKSRKKGKQGPKTWLMLTLLVVAAGVLWVLNTLSVGREIQLATGPESPEQRAFFVDAADRPDMEAFFKGLKPSQRLIMARNIGRYDAPQIASLAAKLLTSFDQGVRRELTVSLVKVAKTQPEAVAGELKHGGNFQRVAVFEALQAAGEKAIPAVAKRLEQDDTRVNAVAFLAQVGEPAVPSLLSVLRGEHKNARLAAADALGKIRSKSAVPDLVRLYDNGLPDERVNYMGALANIGDPSTEDKLVRTLNDRSLATQIRSQAALGLGRIGTRRVVTLLWGLAESVDLELRQSATAGLTLAGDTALSAIPGGVSEEAQVLVAGGVRGQLSNRILARSLQGPSALAAARAASDRPELVTALTSRLRRTPVDDAALADALIQALDSTGPGRRALAKVEKSPAWAGLIDRRRRLGG